MQYRFRIFIQSINNELWETIVNGMFILTHQVNDKVIDKSSPSGPKRQRER